MFKGGDLRVLISNASFGRSRRDSCAHVVNKTRDRQHLVRSLTSLPDTDELDQKIVAEARIEHLADKEDVGRESRLEHDGHVRGVEKTDGVRSAHTTLARRLDGDLDTETLEVDDCAEDSNSCEKIHDVGQVLAVEGLTESQLLVGPCDQKVDESNNGTLELRTSASVDSGGREGLPDNRLADVGGNEERDTTAKTVTLLEKLVKKNDDQSSSKELDNEEDADTGTKVGWLTVETSKNVDASLAEREDNSKKLLGGLVKLAIGLQVEVDVNEMGSGEELFFVCQGLVHVLLLFDAAAVLHTWKTMPEEMIGVIPNSIRVPLLLAIIILSQ